MARRLGRLALPRGEPSSDRGDALAPGTAHHKRSSGGPVTTQLGPVACSTPFDTDRDVDH
jgi:hypothetical protein